MMTKRVFAAAALAVLAAGPVAAQGTQTPSDLFGGIAGGSGRMVLEYRPAARIGFGWDAIRNEPPAARGNCLEPSGTAEQTSTDPATSGWFRLVESKTDMMDAFELSAEAAFRGLVYNAKGSTQFATSQSLSAKNLNLAGRIEADTRVISITTAPGDAAGAGLRIAPAYLALLTSGDPKDLAQFHNDCGDSFVTDIRRGGQLSVALSVSTTSESAKQNLRAAFSGGGAGASVDVSAVASRVSEQAGSRIEGRFEAVGGILPTTGISSPEELKQLLATFAARVAEQDAGRSMIVQSYWTLVPGQDGAFGIPEDAIAAARAYYRLDAAWNLLDSVWGGEAGVTPDWSRAPSRACLGIRKDELRRLADALPDQLHACGEALGRPGGVCAPIVAPVETAAANGCPLTPNLLGGEMHSEWDYLVFLPPPAAQVTDACAKAERSGAERVWSTWVRPIWRAACAENPGARGCESTFEAIAKAAIPSLPRPNIVAGGSYRATCQGCGASVVSDGKITLSCRCKDWNRHLKTTTVTYACPPKVAYANCNGVLKAGNKC